MSGQHFNTSGANGIVAGSTSNILSSTQASNELQLRQETESTGLPMVNQPAQLHGRGRGWTARTQFTQPVIQSRIEPRQQRATNSAAPNTFSEAPPAYEPQRDAAGRPNNNMEDSRLRDEMLATLLRRELANQPQLEERRPQKAIHNWPFRYKGEKDASSLNTFLQRVEIFALSEAVSEDTLLKNIKHLLQDEAITWYGNAYLNGQLDSWETFKVLIRREFLPASYAFAIRVEAYHRLQGDNEPFSKFYQDIATLFHNSEPPMSEPEKLFIVKKNMNSTYASIAAAQQTTNMTRLVQACKEFDELRRMQDGHRRVALPRDSLLEPNLGTPVAAQRINRVSNPSQWFGRVNILEKDGNQQLEHVARAEEDQHVQQPPEEDDRIQLLTEQVNALRARFDRRDSRPIQTNVLHNSTVQQQEHMPVSAQQRPQNMVCWNCDEEGHRFMDCRKQQAVMFCYRCGRKGFSLRSCPTCRQEPGNNSAGNQQ